MEVVVIERREVALDEHLRLAVGLHRVEARRLVEPVAADGAVEAARRGEQEARYAGPLGGARQVHRRAVIDRVGAAGGLRSPRESFEMPAR